MLEHLIQNRPVIVYRQFIAVLNQVKLMFGRFFNSESTSHHARRTEQKFNLRAEKICLTFVANRTCYIGWPHAKQCFPRKYNRLSANGCSQNIVFCPLFYIPYPPP